MKIGSLFSGIGGLELGLEWSGLGETIWQVEQDPFCQAVLARHWPEATRYEDVKTIGSAELAAVDLICGGFPCQDVSSAGKGAGLAGERSGLWFEFARILGEMRPRWVVIENVASGARRWVDQVCAHLGQLGYEALPVPLSAADVGAPHLRRRIFVIAHTHRQPLREQPGRGGWATGKDSPLAGLNGEIRPPAHPDSHRQPAQPIDGEVAELQSVAGHPSPWATAPEFRLLDDGVRPRAHRLRALGNAVVPQCAEVIGHMILELTKASPIDSLSTYG